MSRTCSELHTFRPSECAECRRSLTDIRHQPNKAWRSRLSLPCVHLGNPTGEIVLCKSCGGKRTAPIHECAKLGQCTPNQDAPGYQNCFRCELHTPMSQTQVWPIKYDHHNLFPDAPGKRFNGSIARYKGQLYLCWRSGWAGSEVWMCRLDSSYLPVGQPWQLQLFHPKQANYGREDPRFFEFQGKLHVSYVGVAGYKGNVQHTSFLYARLNDQMHVEQVFYPHYPQRNAWEKNWEFFDYEGTLYAVYSIAPHRILRITGNRADPAFTTPFPGYWPHGEMRGGSNPVLYNGEMWCFFHDRIEDHGHRIYRMGAYTFDPKPPFRVRHFTPEPLMIADRSTKPDDQYASVVWPAGAIVDGLDWVIAIGMHDRWQELHRFPIRDISRRMVDTLPPDSWNYRRDTNDVGVYIDVVRLNEYQLPADLENGLILDVGANIGCFAEACVSRNAGRILSIEFNPEHYSYLKRNMSNNPRVTCQHAAVMDAPGLVELVPTHGNTFTGMPSPSCKGSIPAITLDQAVRDLLGNEPTIRLVKIDIEGGEYAILDSFTLWDVVNEFAIEYHHHPRHLPNLLRSKGYEVSVHPRNNGLGLLFARKQS